MNEVVYDTIEGEWVGTIKWDNLKEKEYKIIIYPDGKLSAKMGNFEESHGRWIEKDGLLRYNISNSWSFYDATINENHMKGTGYNVPGQQCSFELRKVDERSSL